MSRSWTTAIARFVGVAVVATVGAQNAAGACEAAAVKHAESRGVQSDTITDVWTNRESTQEGGLQGYRYWILLTSCRGFAVVEFDLQCQPIQIYTTRDYKLADKP